jgi:hypothetical protein
MTTPTDSPTEKGVEKRSTKQRKRTFEPPMNTDEHRLKADKEKRLHTKNAFVIFMSLSVFIGVHRWLKIVFDHLNLNHSVADFLGACDASVCA